MTDNNTRLEEAMRQDEAKIQMLMNSIHQSLTLTSQSIANESGTSVEISLPLEALSRSISELSLDLDQMIPADQRSNHYTLREKMIPELLNHLDTIVATSSQTIYHQDLFIILANVLMNYVHRNRLYSHALTLGGIEDAKDSDQFSDRSESTA